MVKKYSWPTGTECLLELTAKLSADNILLTSITAGKESLAHKVLRKLWVPACIRPAGMVYEWSVVLSHQQLPHVPIIYIPKNTRATIRKTLEK